MENEEEKNIDNCRKVTKWIVPYYVEDPDVAYHIARNMIFEENKNIEYDESESTATLKSLLYSKNDAINLLRVLAADWKHVKSMMCLGDIYYWGIKENIDYEEAMHYYQKALTIEPENLKAKFCVAYAYYTGKGIDKDEEKAYKMFDELVEVNQYPEALFFLGEFYYFGKVIEQDYKKALYYYEQSLKNNKNVYNSKNRLAEMYLLGKGVEKDCIKAKTYFEDCLENRDDDYPNYMLANIYSGKYGTYNDEQKAIEHFNIVEMDLCISLVFYVLATMPNNEQDLNKVFELLNTKMNIVRNELKQFPYKHPAKLYNDRLKYLSVEEYDDIVQRLKDKVEKCLNDDKFVKAMNLFDCNEDIIVYSRFIVESYRYNKIEDYIQEKTDNKDNSIILFAQKIFDKPQN